MTTSLPCRREGRGRLAERRADDGQGGADHGRGAVGVGQPDGEVGARGGLLQHGQGGAAHPHRLGERGDVGRVAGEHRDGGAGSDTGIPPVRLRYAALVRGPRSSCAGPGRPRDR